MNGEFIDLDRRYNRLEGESSVYIKGLEEERNTLTKTLTQARDENLGLTRSVATLQVAVASAKEQVQDRLQQQRAEFDFASGDLADQLEKSRAAEKARHSVLAKATANLDKAVADLKQTKASLTDLESRHASQGETCRKQEKQIGDLNLQVEGAADALDSMRKDMTEMVDVEIAEKEQQFALVEKSFEETKVVLKETNKEMDSMKKATKLQAIATKLDKKAASDLKREVKALKSQADEQESTIRRMKRAEEARYAETENLYRENET